MQHLTIGCENCLSKNKLTVFGSEFAYECFSCGFRYWIDESAREEYCLLNSLDGDEADAELQDGKPNFAMGEIDK